jgi:hypothetical protein
MTVHAAATSSLADVTAAYNLCNNGDTLTIPAGTSSWTSALTVAKTNLIIQGAGSSSTILTGGSGGNGALFNMTAESANGIRITGINFQSCGLDSGGITFSKTGSPYCTGTKNLRVDNCLFSNYDNPAIQFFGDVSGVVDHCTWNGGPTSSSCVHVFGSDDPTAPNGLSGPPFTLGTSSAIYIEDSTINYTTHMQHFIASRLGSRYVIRYCTFNWLTNTDWDAIDAHDQYEGPTDRGSFTWEVYNNLFINGTGGGTDRVFHLRGGQGAVFGNRIQKNSAWAITIRSYMISDGGQSYPQPDQINHAYFWDNKRNCASDGSGGSTFTVNSDTAELTQGVDYWDSAMPGYVAYTYPHPLQGGSSPSYLTKPALIIR